MAVRKPRPPRKPRAVRVPGGSYMATAGSLGGGELRDAAQEIARDAQARASWSARVPESMRIEGDEKLLTISFDAPAAYPNETGARHPVFARGPDRLKWTWVKGNYRPFLAPAADSRAGEAMAKYAKKIDRLCRERGFG